MKPSPKNVTKPLHHHLFGKIGNTALLVAIGLCFISSVFLVRTAFLSPQMAAVISQSLVTLTNADRSKSELGTLAINPLLTAAAQAKADDMAKKGYFAHTSPDGTTSWFWFKQAGYSYSYAGENLAVDFGDSSDVENAWLNSPTHRANILNSHYTEIGIATAVGMYQGHETTFVVQMFGTPPRSVVPTPQSVTALPQLKVVSLVPVKEPKTAEVAGAATGTPIKSSVTSKPQRVEEVPANVLAATEAPEASTSVSEKQTPAAVFSNFIASPKSLLHTLYLFFAVFIVLAVIMQTLVEWRKGHSKHLIVGTVFLVLMIVLFALAECTLFVPPTILPVGAASST